MQTSILLGIIIMLAFGIADVLIAIPNRKFSPLKVLFLNSIITILFFLALAPFFVQKLPSVDINTLTLIIVASIINFVAVYSFYKAFSQGKIGVVIPISNSYSVVAILLGVVFLSAEITLLQSAGIIIVISSIFALGANLKDIKSVVTSAKNNGVGLALTAMFGWGATIAIIGVVSPVLGWFETAFALSISTGVLSTIFLIVRKEFNFPEFTKKDYNIITIASALLLLGFLALTYGVSTGSIVIVATMAGAAPLVSAVVAHVFTGDKLRYLQYIAVVFVVLGLTLLNF